MTISFESLINFEHAQKMFILLYKKWYSGYNFKDRYELMPWKRFDGEQNRPRLAVACVEQMLPTHEVNEASTGNHAKVMLDNPWMHLCIKYHFVAAHVSVHIWAQKFRSYLDTCFHLVKLRILLWKHEFRLCEGFASLLKWFREKIRLEILLLLWKHCGLPAWFKRLLGWHWWSWNRACHTAQCTGGKASGQGRTPEGLLCRTYIGSRDSMAAGIAWQEGSHCNLYSIWILEIQIFIWN